MSPVEGADGRLDRREVRGVGARHRGSRTRASRTRSPCGPHANGPASSTGKRQASSFVSGSSAHARSSATKATVWMRRTTPRASLGKRGAVGESRAGRNDRGRVRRGLRDRRGRRLRRPPAAACTRRPGAQKRARIRATSFLGASRFRRYTHPERRARVSARGCRGAPRARGRTACRASSAGTRRPDDPPVPRFAPISRSTISTCSERHRATFSS